MGKPVKVGLLGSMLLWILLGALPILPNGQRLWEGYLGTPVSYGRVVLGTEEARTLFYWAEVGTPVVIRR